MYDLHLPKGSKTIFTLGLRYLKNTKTVYILEMISVILVFSIVEIVMFFMNGLQNDQLKAMKEVSSFPLIVENLTKIEAENLKGQLIDSKFISEAYVYKDEYFYISNGNSYNVYIERTIESDYFTNNKFLSHFIYFPTDMRFYKGELYAVPNSLYYNNNENNAIAISNGESGGITISSKKMKNIAPYYSKSYISAPEIIFIPLVQKAIDENTDSEKRNFKLGVYESPISEKGLMEEIQLLNNNVSFSSYKEERTDIYSALMIERYFLMFAMFILTILLFLSFKKTMNNMVDENESEFTILKIYGLDNKALKCIFILTLYIPMVIATILGVVLGSVLTQTRTLEKLVSVVFKEMNNFVFIPNYGAIVLFSVVAMIIPLLLIISSSKKIEKISINNVRDDE